VEGWREVDKSMIKPGIPMLSASDFGGRHTKARTKKGNVIVRSRGRIAGSVWMSLHANAIPNGD
jgi:hypothetical protein